MSTIKQKLRIPIFDHSMCRDKFAAKSVDITKDQICAGGDFSRDACDGGEKFGFLNYELFIENFTRNVINKVNSFQANYFLAN